MPSAIDLEQLGLDGGGQLLIDRALAGMEPGGKLAVRGTHPELRIHLGAWCRHHGHRIEASDDGQLIVVRGRAAEQRLAGVQRAGSAATGAVMAHAQPGWGLAARGALIEPGGPPLPVDLLDRDLVWADVAPRLYANAAANQWDPDTAVDWAAPVDLPADIESAVVQIMTFLVENEQAALIVPARILGRLHPHFREVMQLLAIQAADEARHIEIFNRRALLKGNDLGISGAGGRASLQTLLDEPDFVLGTFLLSVLGEGTFLDMLNFLQDFAPDPVTRRVARLAVQDEARHVTFGVAHVRHSVRSDPSFLSRLRAAVEHRHDVLINTAGLNEKVFNSLVVLAAGDWSPGAIGQGWSKVQQLQQRMDEGRRRRLNFIGFPADEAAEISALHTRNFM
jgi:hypothetical protein